MLRHISCPAFAMPALLAIASLASAQAVQRQPGRAVPNQPNQVNQASQAAQPGQTGQRGQMENHDAFLAEWLILDNNLEIELANFALQKAGSDEVKQFAQRMITDHEKLNSQLSRFTHHQGKANEGAQRPNALANGQPPQQVQNNVPPRGEAQRPQAAQQPARRTVARATEQGEIPAQGRQPDSMLTLKRELADQCLTSARQELDRKSGREFDNCYMHMQIGAHMYVIDAMTVFQRHVSPELQQTIAAGEHTAQEHLQMAKKFVENASQSAGR